MCPLSVPRDSQRLKQPGKLNPPKRNRWPDGLLPAGADLRAPHGWRLLRHVSLAYDLPRRE